MSAKNKILSSILGFFLLVCVAEAIAAYAKFRSFFPGRSALLVLREDLVHPAEKVTVQPQVREENPFLRASPLAGYHLHPFLDYTGVSGQYVTKNDLDYFGFRNSRDHYFETPKLETIVFSGGSEAAGFSHPKTIAQHLEEILNSSGTKKFQVLNLAVNSYTLPNEMNAYLHLGYHLHPRFVISHTGWNDFLYARMVPSKFKTLGLHYLSFQEVWLSRLYDLRPGRRANDWIIDDSGVEKIPGAVLGSLEKYSEIVRAGKGELIVGLQPFSEEYQTQGPKDPIYESVRKDFRSIYPEARTKGYYVMAERLSPLKFRDAIHTLPPEAKRIAEAYAEIIRERFPETRLP